MNKGQQYQDPDIIPTGPLGEQECWENLRNAIILRAVEDYRWSVRQIQRGEKTSLHTARKKEIEAFFHSKWFSTLCTLDGPKLLDGIKKQIGGIE